MTRMVLTARALILAVGLAGWTACELDGIADGQRYSEDFQRSFDLRAGARVEIEGFNGPVEIIGWERDKAELSGTKHAARREALAELKIEITSSPDSLVIRAQRPPGDQSWLRRTNAGVSFRLHVPRKVVLERIVTSNGPVRLESVDGRCRVKTSNGAVRLFDAAGEANVETSNGRIEVDRYTGTADLRTSNGPISAKGVEGQVSASTSNGAIDIDGERLEASKPLKLETSNGSIRVRIGTRGTPEVRAHTSNGRITVSLPSSAGARLRAATSNAGISTDFEMSQTTRTGKNRLEGVIGSGGPLLDLSSSNGAIQLVRN